MPSDLRELTEIMPDLLTADGLARFSAAAAAHVGDETVPGLVALVARGDQVHAEALGSLSIGGPPVQRDSLFRIASTTDRKSVV